MNAYEIARLAQNRRLQSAQFINQYTQNSGTELTRAESGACVFLTADGCGVHADRPLVCRLYPLGRQRTAEGEESFYEIAPHPRSAGDYGTSYTVAEYLALQEAESYIEAVDRYLSLFERMAAALIKAKADNPELCAGDAFGACTDPSAQIEHAGAEWHDIDSLVEGFCAAHHLPVPIDASEKMVLHMRCIEELLDNFTQRGTDEEPTETSERRP